MNLPEKIMNHILSFRPTNPIAKIIKNKLDSICQERRTSITEFLNLNDFYV